MLLLIHAIILSLVKSYNLEMDIYGHRGGVLQLIPEHTIASYSLGAQEGADYLEPDLLLSKDGELIVLHDLDLSKTTDIASHTEFQDRLTSITVWRLLSINMRTNQDISHLILHYPS